MTNTRLSLRFVVLTLAAVSVAAATFSLGQWQLRRAAQKESLQAEITAKNSLSALDGVALLAIKNIANEIHRPVVLEGVWQAAHTVYLENRPMNGQPGFWVITPLTIKDSGQVVVVQRGWIPRNFVDRTSLPPVVTPPGVVRVQGRIALPPSKLYEFRPGDAGLIRQNLDLDAYRTQTGLALLDVSILQTGAPSDGLRRDWAAPTAGVDKHYGYAFQWYGLCALVVVLYGWFQIGPRLRSQ